jgi:hypothetical protein
VDQSSTNSSTTFYKRFTALEKQVAAMAASPTSAVPPSSGVSAPAPDSIHLPPGTAGVDAPTDGPS